MKYLAFTMVVAATVLQGANAAGAQELEIRTRFAVPVGCPSAREAHEYNQAGAAIDTDTMGGCHKLTGHRYDVVRKSTLDGQVYVCARDENKGKCLWVLDR